MESPIITLTTGQEVLWRNTYGLQYTKDMGTFGGFVGSLAGDASAPNPNIIAVTTNTVTAYDYQSNQKWIQTVSAETTLTQPYVLPDNTTVCGGKTTGNIYFFAISNGAYTTITSAFGGSDIPKGFNIYPDGTFMVYGSGYIAKYSSDKSTQLWKKATALAGTGPNISGAVSDGNNSIYLWYDTSPGIYVYDSNGNYLRSVTTANGISLQTIKGVAITETGSFILSITSTPWSGLISLNLGAPAAPVVPKTATRPIISGHPDRQGLGTMVTNGGDAWGP